MQPKKISMLPPPKWLETPRWSEVSKIHIHLKQYKEINSKTGISAREEGGHRTNPFHWGGGGGVDIVWNNISVRSNNYTILQCSFCLVVLISIVFLRNRCTGHCWSIDIWSFFIHTRWYKDATVHDESESCSPRRHNCCCCRWCCVHAFSWQSKQEVLNNSVFPRAEFEFWPSSVESNIVIW